MPKRRSASACHWAGVKSIFWLMASMTMKSLPAPCILVNWSFMVGRSLVLVMVERSLAFGARLEAFMGPEVFGRRFAHALFDEGIHAARGSRDVFAGVVVPRWIIRHFPALVIGQEGGDHGDHLRPGSQRQARRGRQGGGWHAKERHEFRVFF